MRVKKALSGMILFTAIGFVLALTSCDSFLDGKNLAEQLEQKISYENSPSHKIQVTSKCGKTSPDGADDYKVTDTKPLMFTESQEYKFVEWRVKDKNTGADVTDKNYIKIDNPYETDTSFTFVKTPEDNISLLIEPDCLERPKIVNFTPAYDSDGVYRDRRITIMFNRKLDSETIYYSSEERIAIQKSKATINWLEDNGKAYGYKIDDDDNSIVYKCLTITKLYDENVNLLKHYGVPRFDDGNTYILIVPAKVYDKDNDQLPPAATDILVNVSKNIGVSKINSDGTTIVAGIYFDDPKSYFTNSKHDSDPPEFVDFSVKNEDNQTLTTDGVDGQTENPNSILQTKTIKVSGKISDTGTGPKSLTAIINIIPNDFYNISSIETKLWTVSPNLEIIGSTGEIKTGTTEGFEINLENLIEEKYQGVYTIKFIAMDKNEQTSESETYYFVQDTTPPKEITAINKTRTGDTTATLSWTVTDQDFAKAVIKTTKVKGPGTNTIADVTVERNADNSNSYNVVLDNLEARTKYTHTVTFYDYTGNASEPYTFPADNTPPATIPVKKMYCERYGANNVTLGWWKTIETDYSSAVIKTTIIGGKGTKSISDRISTQRHTDSTNYEFGIAYVLEDQTKYKYTLVFYDYEGNPSEEMVFPIDNTGPKIPADIVEERTGASSLKLTWTQPSDIDYAKTVVKTEKVTGSGTTTVAEKTYAKGEKTEQILEGLEKQVVYKHTFTFYDYDGNTSVTTVTDNTPPDPRKHFFLGAKDKGLKGVAVFPESSDCSKLIVLVNGVEKDLYNNDVCNFTGLTNGTEYEVKVKAVDYSGNVSEAVGIKETPGVRLGLICYASANKEIICSDNIYTDVLSPIGVVSYIPDDKSKVRVWDVKDDSTRRIFYPAKLYYKDVGPLTSLSDDDGLFNYTAIKTFNSTNTSLFNKGDYGQIYPYLYEINEDSPVIWYLPAFNEMTSICKNSTDEAIVAAYKALNDSFGIEAIYLYMGSSNNDRNRQFVSRLHNSLASNQYSFDPYCYVYANYNTKTPGAYTDNNIPRYNHYMCQVDLSSD